MIRKLENLLAFQIGWLGCVLSAAYGLPLAGLIVATLVTTLHLWRSEERRRELRLIGSAIALGTITDTLLLATGWLSYSTGQLFANVAPYWIIAMWPMFATTLNESLAWLARSRLLAAVSGALFAPLAYWAGARLGAITLIDPEAALIAVGALWAVVLPILIHLAGAFSSSSAETTEGAAASGKLASHA
jgi:hypothetical protein